MLFSTIVAARRSAVVVASGIVAFAFGLGPIGNLMPVAGAYAPECTTAQPYPNSPYDICTGYGQTCARSMCSSPPGTPGKWGTDGSYTPCTYRNGCS